MDSLRKKGRTLLAWLRRVKQISDEDLITVFAAKASYFVLLSAIPVVMLFVLIAGVVYPLDAAEIARITAKFLPAYMAPFGTSVLTEVFTHTNIPLLSVSAVTLLWAASRGMRSIGEGLQYVFDRAKARRYILSVVYSFVYTLGFIIMMALTLAVLVFGEPIQHMLDAYLYMVPRFIYIIVNFRNLIFLCILTLMFMAMYSGLARSHIPFRSQFFGAFLAAAGWLLFSYLFSAYITYFTETSYIYGSLAAIIIFMLWLDICMIILLAGAEINKRRFDRARGEKTGGPTV
ncbi:MAG: YihY/virulence factor BrkB family protein [Oscillospiraceae bacterium]|nr:YihY/virulence factor BrkB family protein [Oscillospiraceae bacterium]